MEMNHHIRERALTKSATALVRAKSGMPIVSEEIFAPILYLIEFDNLEDAIEQHNAVPQGLSSAMFTTNLISAETFLSHRGSDCGIANINIGTSGADLILFRLVAARARIAIIHWCKTYDRLTACFPCAASHCGDLQTIGAIGAHSALACKSNLLNKCLRLIIA